MNEDLYKEAFVAGLSIDITLVKEDLKYNDIPEWDSIGHMSLMSELEEKFEITLETDDIIEFESYKKGKEILKKYISKSN